MDKHNDIAAGGNVHLFISADFKLRLQLLLAVGHACPSGL